MVRPKKSTKKELPEEEEDTRFKDTGLSTGLKRTFGLKTENHGSKNLEGFLTAVEKPPQGGFTTPMH